MNKIGSFKPKNRYFLAPMAEINDIGFRELCLEAGAGLVYTGMINPLTRQELLLEDKPVLQLFGREEKGVKEFIKKYEKKVAFFDFNLGCPACVAERSGFGAYMNKDLKTIERILKTMRGATKKPITVKLRKTPYTFKILKIAEKYCDAVGLHARTVKQGYAGKADLEFALKFKARTRLPVIYSGDVNEKNVDELLKKFDFVMIGREAIGNPNVFAKIVGKKARFGFGDYLKLALKYGFKFPHIRSQAMYFTKYHPKARRLREKLSKAKNIPELKESFGIKD